eukprot:2474389-Amphidinium_carterae.1
MPWAPCPTACPDTCYAACQEVIRKSVPHPLDLDVAQQVPPSAFAKSGTELVGDYRNSFAVGSDNALTLHAFTSHNHTDGETAQQGALQW